ncbi:MAG: VWA domain-containing protein, partial [Bacteroidetes bacterium]
MISNLSRLEFASPWALGLLALPLLMVLWQVWRYNSLYPTLRIPGFGAIAANKRPLRGFVKKYLFVLRALSVALLVVALARPQIPLREEEIATEGIDIIMSVDISGSMEALDFKPNRMTAAKATARTFIESRQNDRIGLVAFAGESFTQCPLTADHDMLIRLLDELQSGMLEAGTAIGLGLANAVIRLRESPSKSKVIILLTDGDNNAGAVDPLTAADAANQFGIRVYTIGVGKNGMAPFRVQDLFGNYVEQFQEVRLDEALLQEISAKTGG